MLALKYTFSEFQFYSFHDFTKFVSQICLFVFLILQK